MSLDNGQDALIDPYGGCRNVKSYQMAEIVYDATVSFCNRFVHYLLRTHDQKVQAARGGKQTIAEGCMQEEVEIKKYGVKILPLTGLFSCYFQLPNVESCV